MTDICYKDIMSGDSEHKIGKHNVCSYHIDFVEKVGRIEGKLDLMCGMLKESLTKQEGFLKKIDEHTSELNKHSQELVRVEDVKSGLNEQEKDVNGIKQDIAVLKESKNTKAAIIAVVFTAVINAIVIAVSRVLGIHHTGGQ